MPVEDSKQIEDEVMAELRSALHLHESQPPTPMISIPQVVKSLHEGSTEGTEEGSFEEDDKDTLVKVKGGSPMRDSIASLDGSAMNDSFVMGLSSNMSLGGSCSAMSDTSSQRFYIGTVNEEGEEGSMQSHVINLGTDEMSHDELIDTVQRLYEQLKKADETISKERKRRYSREKNLLKLAKELGKQKDAANQLLSKIEEMREELRMVNSEKGLLEQRLEQQKRANKKVRTACQEQADQEIQDLVQNYERSIAEHDGRISDLNKTYARQCEQLCREIVEANKEVVRLQKVLSEMTRGAYPVDRTFVSTIAREDDLSRSPSSTSKQKYSKGVDIYTTMLLVLGAVALGHKLDTIHAPVHEWMGQYGLSDGNIVASPSRHNSTTVTVENTVDKARDPNILAHPTSKKDDSGAQVVDDDPSILQQDTEVSMRMAVNEMLLHNPIRVLLVDAKLPFKWLRKRVVMLLDFLKTCLTEASVPQAKLK